MSTNCIRCVKNKRTGMDLLCDECRASGSSPATGSAAWRPITEHEPQCGEIVWLWDGVSIWIGGRDMVDGEYWLWGKCYGLPWFDGVKWEGEPEMDDDYLPKHYMPLPLPPTETSETRPNERHD